MFVSYCTTSYPIVCKISITSYPYDACLSIAIRTLGFQVCTSCSAIPFVLNPLLEATYVSSPEMARYLVMYCRLALLLAPTPTGMLCYDIMGDEVLRSAVLCYDFMGDEVLP